MNEHTFSNEVLMAYADGELDDATADALLAALPDDPALMARLSVFLDTRTALSPQAPPEPVPEKLMAQVRATLDAARQTEDDTVVPFARPLSSQTIPRWQPMALAASLALAVGLGAGLWSAKLLPGTQNMLEQVSLMAVPGLDSALSNTMSGETRDLETGTLTIITSFQTADGALCREFEFDARAGDQFISVACHAENHWGTQLAILTGSQAETGYTPASSLDTLDAYLTSIGAGAPLSAEQEAAALGGIDGAD